MVYDLKSNEWGVSLRGIDHSPDLTLVCKEFGGGMLKHDKSEQLYAKNPIFYPYIDLYFLDPFIFAT